MSIRAFEHPGEPGQGDRLERRNEIKPSATRQSVGLPRQGWALGSVMALAAISQLPALWGGFVHDDFDDVVDNPSAKAASFAGRLGAMTRPVLKASYALQDALHGPNAFAFHLVNLSLHVVSTGLLAALLRRAARLAGHDERRAGWIGGLAAAIWAVHPAAADTVGQVAGRSAGLSTAFVLFALWLATGPRARPLAVGLVTALAVLGRETAVAAPVLLALWHICLPGTEKASRAVPVWIGALVAILLLVAMPRYRELAAFSLDQRGPLDAVRANLFAVGEMLRLWGTPWQIGAMPPQPVVHAWGEGPTLLRLIMLGGGVAAALLLRRRWPLLALGILWVGVALLPSNSVIYRINPVAMRPMYLAGIGLALILGAALAHNRAGRPLATFLIAGLASLSWQREALLSDPVAFFADAAQKNPDQAAPQVLLGLALANAGWIDAARQALEKALQIDPANHEAANALRLLEAGSVYSPVAP